MATNVFVKCANGGLRVNRRTDEDLNEIGQAITELAQRLVGNVISGARMADEIPFVTRSVTASHHWGYLAPDYIMVSVMVTFQE